MSDTLYRPGMKICVIGTQAHCDEAGQLAIPFMSVEDLKKFNKNKKIIKKFAKKYVL
jgi:large subunit ribosomal protein L10Ae